MKALRRSEDGAFVRPPEPPVELHTELMNLLQSRTRVDFREYKDQTINRRILRRMDALSIEAFEDYVRKCRDDVSEIDILHKDFLISVTRFFRDLSQFRQLEREIGRIVETKISTPIRVWVAGCATGEEAYTVAILIAEALGGAKMLEQKGVQIFATDIDERALDVARKGSYPVTAAHDIPPEYLEKYFRIGPRTIDIAPELRAVTLFSKHNLCQDPPFINIDLVTLRNVLIYFKPVLQQRVLSRVHYSLGKRGVLLLGTSEAVRSMDLLFETKQDTDKIYIKRNATRPESLFNPETIEPSALTPPGAPISPRSGADTDGQMFDALARAVAPNGFVITRNQDIIRVFGDVSPMLELTEKTSLRLSTRILRRGLREEAPGLISVAFRHKESRDGRWHNVLGPGFNQVKMICYPIFATEGEDHLLVAFRTRTQDQEAAPIESLSDQERTQYILQIETEMQSTREALQQTVEELQTTNEELQSVNEELQSTNEELQATNEELETSNEELQSTNEELITVNEEMRINSTEFQRVSRELSALLSASPNPVLVVDHALLVRRASNSALSYFNIAEVPINGLHLGQLPILNQSPMLAQIAANVFETRQQEALEITKDNQLHTAVIAPFSEGKGDLIGLTVSVFDNEAKIMGNMTDALETLGDTGTWSYNVRTGLLYVPEHVLNQTGIPSASGSVPLSTAEELLHPDDSARIKKQIKALLKTPAPFHLQTRIVTKSGKVLHIQFAGSPVLSESGDIVSVAGAFRDTTESSAKSAIFESMENIQAQLGVGVFSYDVEGDMIFLTDVALQALERDGEENAQKSVEPLTSAFKDPDRAELEQQIRKLIKSGGAFSKTFGLVSPGHARCDVKAWTKVNDGGAVSHIFGSISPETD